ncbi:MAG: hypothetical protein ABF608_11335 [Sporolactobacillus sp.]
MGRGVVPLLLVALLLLFLPVALTQLARDQSPSAPDSAINGQVLSVQVTLAKVFENASLYVYLSDGHVEAIDFYANRMIVQSGTSNHIRTTKKAYELTLKPADYLKFNQAYVRATGDTPTLIKGTRETLGNQ